MALNLLGMWPNELLLDFESGGWDKWDVKFEHHCTYAAATLLATYDLFTTCHVAWRLASMAQTCLAVAA
jgi:hypothetical protein